MKVSNIKIQFLKFSVVLKQRNMTVVTYLNRLCSFIPVGRGMDWDHGACLGSKHLWGESRSPVPKVDLGTVYLHFFSIFITARHPGHLFDFTWFITISSPESFSPDRWSASPSPESRVPHQRAGSTSRVTLGPHWASPCSALRCFWVLGLTLSTADKSLW